MLATIENMQKFYRAGVVAFSPLTGEEVSANPGDYFYLAPGDVLTDAEGEPMILVTEHTTLIPLEGQDTYEDWRYEIANGDTILGLMDWMRVQREMEVQSMRYGDGFNLGVSMTEYGVRFSVEGYPVLTAEMSADELIDLIPAAKGD